jgi:hypothetical protein
MHEGLDVIKIKNATAMLLLLFNCALPVVALAHNSLTDVEKRPAGHGCLMAKPPLAGEAITATEHLLQQHTHMKNAVRGFVAST